MSHDNTRSDELDLRELISVLWHAKLSIISFVFIFAIGSVIFALSLDNIYRSEALVTPAEDNDKSGLNNIAGNLGGLAAIAGINLGDQLAVDKTQLTLSILKSRDFISSFIQENNLKPLLFAVDKWDADTGKIIFDKKIYDHERGEWTREVSFPLKQEPSLQESYRKFKEIFSVEQGEQPGFYSISVEHQSPVVAYEILSSLLVKINDFMKERDRLEATKSIDFLNKQLREVSIADLRQVIYELIEQQTKTLMFTEVRDEYALKTVDPAVIPELRFKPSRVVICITLTFLGGVFGCLFVLIRWFLKD